LKKHFKGIEFDIQNMVAVRDHEVYFMREFVWMRGDAIPAAGKRSEGRSAQNEKHQPFSSIQSHASAMSAYSAYVSGSDNYQ
jgi:hypothetical protein